MKVLTSVCLTVMLLAASHMAGATLYYNAGEWGAGPLEPIFLGSNLSYDVQPYYRIVKLDWRVTNNDSVAYNDVKMVLPFVWDSGNPLQTYTWVDAANEWIISDRGNGLDGLPDGCYAKLPTVSYTPSPIPPTETRMLMSDTDLPLSYSYAGYETASVLSTDSVPAWSLIASLAPNDSITFSTYIQVERGANISSFWDQPYIVAVPEPATMLLLGLGGLTLLRKRR